MGTSFLGTPVCVKRESIDAVGHTWDAAEPAAGSDKGRRGLGERPNSNRADAPTTAPIIFVETSPAAFAAQPLVKHTEEKDG
jgi:hypothetical protein